MPIVTRRLAVQVIVKPTQFIVTPTEEATIHLAPRISGGGGGSWFLLAFRKHGS